MTIPLMVLAVLSVIGGALGFPEFWHLPNWMHHHLESVILRPGYSLLSHQTEWTLMGIAVAAALAVTYFTYLMFMKYGVLPADREEQLKPWQRLIYNKYYVDEIYEAVIRKPLDAVSSLFYRFVDRQVIDGLVNSVGSSVKFVGSSVRYLQSGNIGFYIMNMVLGVVLIILLTFIIR